MLEQRKLFFKCGISPLVEDLVYSAVKFKPEDRPTCAELLKHPLFDAVKTKKIVSQKETSIDKGKKNNPQHQRSNSKVSFNKLVKENSQGEEQTLGDKLKSLNSFQCVNKLISSLNNLDSSQLVQEKQKLISLVEIMDIHPQFGSKLLKEKSNNSITQ